MYEGKSVYMLINTKSDEKIYLFSCSIKNKSVTLQRKTFIELKTDVR